MTALTLHRAVPGTLFDQAAGAPDRPSRSAPLGAGGGPTLAEVISRAWEAVHTGVEAACPVCSGELVAIPPASGGGVPAARCRDCGSELR